MARSIPIVFAIWFLLKSSLGEIESLYSILCLACRRAQMQPEVDGDELNPRSRPRELGQSSSRADRRVVSESSSASTSVLDNSPDANALCRTGLALGSLGALDPSLAIAGGSGRPAGSHSWGRVVLVNGSPRAGSLRALSRPPDQTTTLAARRPLPRRAARLAGSVQDRPLSFRSREVVRAPAAGCIPLVRLSWAERTAGSTNLADEAPGGRGPAIRA